MNYDDDSEYEDGEIFVMAPDITVGAAPVRQQAPQVLDHAMIEAERRVSKAGYYRVLLHGSIFDDDGDQIAREVEQEIRGFVKERFNVLLGIAAPKPPEETLTGEDIKILKSLIDSVKRRAQTPRSEAPVLQPIVTPVVAAPEPVIQPKVKSVPKLRKRSRTPGAEVEMTPEPQASGRLPRRKLVKTVSPNGKEVVMDLTGQTRPAPGTATPVPAQNTPHAQQNAMHHMAMNSLTVNSTDK